MTMGQRIRAARLEAGLSQRQLAGGEITRNMLSALENDSANPSVATLRHLSKKLCKPISYFLGEDIPEAAEMAQARAAFTAGEFHRCLALLAELSADYTRQERLLLECLAAMTLARRALEEEKQPYAAELLDQSLRAGEKCLYFTDTIHREWLILSAQCARQPSEQASLAARIPQDDDVLLLKARAALDNGDPLRAAQLLDAAEDQDRSDWIYLRSEVYFARKDYRQAARFYHRIEDSIPVDSRLEICYREMNDFKMAYYYATKK